MVFSSLNKYKFSKSIHLLITHPRDDRMRIALPKLVQLWQTFGGPSIWTRLCGYVSCSTHRSHRARRFSLFRVYDPAAKCNGFHTIDGMVWHRWQWWHSLPMSWYEPIRCWMHCKRHRWYESYVLYLQRPRQNCQSPNEVHDASGCHHECEHHGHGEHQSENANHKIVGSISRVKTRRCTFIERKACEWVCVCVQLKKFK